MSVTYGFTGGYSPGGAVRSARDRQVRGGRLSGRKRRQLSRAKRRYRPGQLRAQLTYEPRQPTRREFERRYEARFPVPPSPQGNAQWEIGRETAWRVLVGTGRLVAARGQHCGTTKPDRWAELQKRDYPRHQRTIQRTMRRLEALGYVGFMHVRTPPGRKDYLRVEWRLHRRSSRSPLDVSPPSGTTNYGASPHLVRCRTPEIAPATRAVPPDGGDEQQAASRPGTERERVEAELRFQELKLELGFGPQGQVRLQIDRLRATLELGPAPSPHEGSDGRRI